MTSFELQRAEPFFLRRDALAAGYDDRAPRRSARAGVITRIRRGAYAFTDVWDSLGPAERHVVRSRAVLRAAETDLALSHISAAAAWAAPLWDLPLESVHVTRLDGRLGRREAGVVQHGGATHEGDIANLDGSVRITSPARTAIDLTTITDIRHALPVLDDLLHRGLTTHDELVQCAEFMRAWPGTVSSRLCIALADGRSESPGESLTRYAFWRCGLPAPALQVDVRDDSGTFLGRVDFAWPELGVFVEFDGRVKYESLRRPGESVVDVVLREKRREEAICEATGWICIRVVWDDLFHPEQLAVRIRRAMARHAA